MRVVHSSLFMPCSVEPNDYNQLLQMITADSARLSIAGVERHAACWLDQRLRDQHAALAEYQQAKGRHPALDAVPPQGLSYS